MEILTCAGDTREVAVVCLDSRLPTTFSTGLGELKKILAERTSAQRPTVISRVKANDRYIKRKLITERERESFAMSVRRITIGKL